MIDQSTGGDESDHSDYNALNQSYDVSTDFDAELSAFESNEAIWK